MKNSKLTTYVFSAIASVMVCPMPTNAQEFQAPDQPEAPMVDQNGVSIPSGQVVASAPVMSIGGAEPLVLTVVNNPSGYDGGGRPVSCQQTIGDNCNYEPYLRSGFYPQYNLLTSLEGGIVLPPPQSITARKTVFSYGGVSETFSGPEFYSNYPQTRVSLSQNGGELIQLGNYEYQYTDRNGAVYDLGGPTPVRVNGIDIPVTRVEYPNGRVVELTYEEIAPNGVARLVDVRDNYGFVVRLEYDSSNFVPSDAKASLWYRRARAGNLAVDPCSQAAASCSFSAQRFAQNSWNAQASSISIGTPEGEATRFSQSYYWDITSITPIGYEVPAVTYELCGRRSGELCTHLTSDNLYPNSYGPGGDLNWWIYPGKVNRAFAEGNITQYGFTANVGGYILRTVNTNDYRGTDELQQRSHPNDSSLRGQYYFLDIASGTRYTFTGDDTNRITSVTNSGVSTNYTYDSRGNITSLSVVSDDGSQTRTTFYSYPQSCSNRVICNQPTAITDALGNTTDLEYDPVHGGVLSVTQPPDDNGIRPQSRYTYVERFAGYHDSSGSIANSPNGIWLLASESFCRTSAWAGTQCAAGASDEVITTYDYGPTTGPNNLLLRGVAVTADGETLRACYTYDEFGQRISETAPAANLTSCS